MNKKWQTSNESPPSALIPTIPRIPSLLQITDIDVNKVREVYGSEGFFAFSNKNIPTPQPTPEPEPEPTPEPKVSSDDPFEGISDGDIADYSDLFDVPPPENDDEAIKLGNKIRDWIKHGRPDPTKTEDDDDDDDYSDEDDDDDDEPEVEIQKHDKEEKPKKKRGMFGFFKR